MSQSKLDRDDLHEIWATDRATWRAWLEAHHDQGAGCLALLLEEGQRQSEHGLERRGRRGALLRLDRQHAQDRR